MPLSYTILERIFAPMICVCISESLCSWNQISHFVIFYNIPKLSIFVTFLVHKLSHFMSQSACLGIFISSQDAETMGIEEIGFKFCCILVLYNLNDFFEIIAFILDIYKSYYFRIILLIMRYVSRERGTFHSNHVTILLTQTPYLAFQGIHLKEVIFTFLIVYCVQNNEVPELVL